MSDPVHRRNVRYLTTAHLWLALFAALMGGVVARVVLAFFALMLAAGIVADAWTEHKERRP